MAWKNLFMMSASVTLGAAMAFAQKPTPKPFPTQGKDPLGDLFPPEEMKDATTLDLKILNDSVYEPKSAPGKNIRRIEIEFTSFEWAGETWRHRAYLLIPSERPAAYRDAGVIYAAGSADKGEATALMGIASLTLQNVPGTRYGVKAAGALMTYGNERFFETGDPRWLGYPWLGKIFVRAVTAAQSVPEFGARQFVVTGASKWGAAAWIAAGADDRIVGAVPRSWNIGNVERALELKAQRWGLDHKGGKEGAKGPGFQTTARQLEFVRNPIGRQSLAYTDPYQFRNRLEGKPILYIHGTNDPLSHVASDTVFLPHMPATVRILHTPNAGHGASPWDEKAWLMWLAHVFAGRDAPRIDVTTESRDARQVVTATVVSRTQVKKVALWTARDKTRSFLEAKWDAADMRAMGDGRYQASFEQPTEGSVGYIIMVEDEDPATVPGVITSGFHEWPRASF